MGSCCIQSKQSLKHRTLQKAYNIFYKISIPNKKIINRQAIQQYFQQYTQACYQILMRQMDFNHDGVITQNQWIAYWEYIRKAGYQLNKIQQQLNRIEKGNITLSFPKAKNYQPNQPRMTLLNTIINQMKNDGTAIPFLSDLRSTTDNQLINNK